MLNPDSEIYFLMIFQSYVIQWIQDERKAKIESFWKTSGFECNTILFFVNSNTNFPEGNQSQKTCLFSFISMP